MNTIKLLKKDMILLKGYGLRNLFIVLIIVVGTAAMVGPGSLYYLFPYMFSRYYLSAVLNYEDSNNGYLNMSVLPVDRKSIVRSKYLLLMALFAAAVIVGIGFAYVGTAVGIFGQFYVEAENIILSFLIIAITDGLRIPFIIKYGEVKSRIINYITQILALGIYFAIAFISDETFMKFAPDTLGSAILVIGVAVVIMGGSYLLSVKFLTERDL